MPAPSRQRDMTSLLDTLRKMDVTISTARPGTPKKRQRIRKEEHYSPSYMPRSPSGSNAPPKWSDKERATIVRKEAGKCTLRSASVNRADSTSTVPFILPFSAPRTTLSAPLAIQGGTLAERI